MGIQPANVINPNVVLELLTGFSSLLEEVGPKPDLLQVSLMRILRQYLLDSNLSFGRLVNAEPNYAEASSAKQAYSSEVLRKTFSEFIVLVSCEVHSNIERVLILIAVIDFESFFLGVFGLIDVVVSFLEAAAFFF